jgi:hypothetical protein
MYTQIILSALSIAHKQEELEAKYIMYTYLSYLYIYIFIYIHIYTQIILTALSIAHKQQELEAEVTNLQQMRTSLNELNVKLSVKFESSQVGIICIFILCTCI